MLHLIRGYGLTLDEAEQRMVEWCRINERKRISTSLARKAYTDWYGRRWQHLNASLINNVDRYWLVLRFIYEEEDLNAMLDRVAPLPKEWLPRSRRMPASWKAYDDFWRDHPTLRLRMKLPMDEGMRIAVQVAASPTDGFWMALRALWKEDERFKALLDCVAPLPKD